jgi:hypothetical protein
MINIRLNSFKEISEYLRDNKTSFFDLIIEKTEYAFDNKIDIINIAEFYVLDKTVKIQISDTDWITTLILALEHFESIEEYERCVMISELITKIKNDDQN